MRSCIFGKTLRAGMIATNRSPIPVLAERANAAHECGEFSAPYSLGAYCGRFYNLPLKPTHHQQDDQDDKQQSTRAVIVAATGKAATTESEDQKDDEDYAECAEAERATGEFHNSRFSEAHRGVNQIRNFAGSAQST
jgi:hypothetical protein